MVMSSLRALCVLVFTSVAAFAIPAYDLRADWHLPDNPNGPWALYQNTTLIPYHSGVCCLAATSGYAPDMFAGGFLPAWVQVPGDNGDAYRTDDILVHSADPFNGDPELGEARLVFTTPVSGLFNINFSIWYAQPDQDRSNDFFLRLRGDLLVDGAVNLSNYFDEWHPFTFTLQGVELAAGDEISLVVARSEGQANGSFADVDLNISEAPEPATASGVLLAAGVLLVSIGKRRRRA
jgi:hypothetical protein